MRTVSDGTGADGTAVIGAALNVGGNDDLGVVREDGILQNGGRSSGLGAVFVG